MICADISVELCSGWCRAQTSICIGKSYHNSIETALGVYCICRMNIGIFFKWPIKELHQAQHLLLHSVEFLLELVLFCFLPVIITLFLLQPEPLTALKTGWDLPSTASQHKVISCLKWLNCCIEQRRTLISLSPSELVRWFIRLFMCWRLPVRSRLWEGAQRQVMISLGST